MISFNQKEPSQIMHYVNDKTLFSLKWNHKGFTLRCAEIGYEVTDVSILHVALPPIIKRINEVIYYGINLPVLDSC